MKMKNESFERSHSAEKRKWVTLWNFSTSIRLRNIKKIEEGPFEKKNFSKKSQCQKN